jgi:hypothetical protein
VSIAPYIRRSKYETKYMCLKLNNQVVLKTDIC